MPSHPFWYGHNQPLGQSQSSCSRHAPYAVLVSSIDRHALAVVGGQCPPYISSELSDAQLGASFTADNIVRHAIVFGY
jgi:hypothetical protein